MSCSWWASLRKKEKKKEQKQQRHWFSFRELHETNNFIPKGAVDSVFQCCQDSVFEIKSSCMFPCKLIKRLHKFLGSAVICLISDQLFCLLYVTFKSLMRISKRLICSSVLVSARTFCSWDLISWSSSPIVLKSFSNVITQLSQAKGTMSKGKQYVLLILVKRTFHWAR